jgi:DNA primase large subunit
MSKSLVTASKSLSVIMRDERLAPLLSNMHKQYVGKDYGSSATITENITPEQIDSLAKSAMPLCMSHLHHTLKTEKHLKHSGRMQYGLFLKSMGLKLEDALVFWKHHFSKVGPENFDKKYAYNIRHNYGKEGKRVDYTPYSCMKIIQGPVPSGKEEAHGKKNIYHRHSILYSVFYFTGQLILIHL